MIGPLTKNIMLSVTTEETQLTSHSVLTILLNDTIFINVYVENTLFSTVIFAQSAFMHLRNCSINQFYKVWLLGIISANIWMSGFLHFLFLDSLGNTRVSLF